VDTSYSYDNLSRLLSVLHNGGYLPGSTSYVVDAAGNRTSKTALQQADPNPVSVTSNYTYDNIYQLTNVLVGENQTEHYIYDTLGNRTASLSPASYIYNSSNQLTSTSAATYTYDYNGNTTSKTDTTGTTSYTWDYEKRLTSVTLPGTGGTVYFNYDPMGRRIRKVFGSATSIYAYDGDNVVEELDSSGNIVAHYTQGTGIDEPLAMYRGLTTSYFHADGLGSITSLTDGSGQLAASYVYGSFGKLAASTGSVTNPFQYTGREFDAETGLYYYRARYFDQTTGRFISEDPIGFFGGINFYSYVKNNPIDFTDPSGLVDYSEAQTFELLQRIYAEATAGPIQGLENIYANSNSGGKYDFGYKAEHINDTWTWCGKKMNRDQFGNFVGGFEGASYDRMYFLTTGGVAAEYVVHIYGIKFHLAGNTKAKNDPLDFTGLPDILTGRVAGWSFNPNRDRCGCRNNGITGNR
ncbi:MAG: RHS repeat-associated core domain-containing protein, partial [Negativicutes bacterium]|nr:RHS repeat-associated core domain-containing protein [Negativicutes bacterium]